MSLLFGRRMAPDATTAPVGCKRGWVRWPFRRERGENEESRLYRRHFELEAAGRTDPGLQAVLWVSRSTFNLDDTVQWHFVAWNEGKDRITVQHGLASEWQLKVFLATPDDRIIDLVSGVRTLMAPPTREHYVTLWHGESFGRTEPLCLSQVSRELGGESSRMLVTHCGHGDPERPLPAGKYTMYATAGLWWSGEELGLRAWTGQLRTDDVVIDVR